MTDFRCFSNMNYKIFLYDFHSPLLWSQVQHTHTKVLFSFGWISMKMMIIIISYVNQSLPCKYNNLNSNHAQVNNIIYFIHSICPHMGAPIGKVRWSLSIHLWIWARFYFWSSMIDYYWQNNYLWCSCTFHKLHSKYWRWHICVSDRRRRRIGRRRWRKKENTYRFIWIHRRRVIIRIIIVHFPN